MDFLLYMFNLILQSANKKIPPKNESSGGIGGRLFVILYILAPQA